MRPAEQLRLLLARPLLLLAVAAALQWLTTLVVALEADGVDVGAIEIASVLLLGPAALVSAYRIGARLGGPALAAWMLLVWLAAPWLARVMTLAGYDQTLGDHVLPLTLGLTDEPGYSAGIALLAATALLTLPDPRASLAAGLAAGAGVLLAPPAILFVVPALLALVAARRPLDTARFVAPLVPALVAMWLLRDLSFGELSTDRLQGNMAGLREYFWSQRLLQWLPLAGVIAVARRSLPLALLLGGWFGAFVAFQLSSTRASFEGGDVFLVLLPALPAYVVLAASLPLLVPTLATRLGPLARPAESR